MVSCPELQAASAFVRGREQNGTQHEADYWRRSIAGRCGGSRENRHGSTTRRGGRGVAPRFVLALDQGTSSSRALVFDERGRIIAGAQHRLASRFPEPGWVEQSPRDIWATQLAAAREAVAQVGVGAIRAVALTNQRETALLWHRERLEPVGPAIVWQCRRTADIASALEAKHGDQIRLRSGLTPDAYFSGPKISWLLDNIPRARTLAETGDLVSGTVDSWLLANLTGGKIHATDATNASRTMLWNLRSREWDKQLCDWQSVPESLLADVLPSAHEFGVIDPALLGRPLPILAVAGDQQAALYGHGIAAPGAAKCTYGTGAFVLSHAGDSSLSVGVPNGLLLTAAADGGVAFEGGVFTAGSVVQWLRDELELAATAPEISSLAASADSSGGISLVPALAGLGSPHWDAGARGAILGITRATTTAHIARAALEAVAFRVREIVEAMESAGTIISELRADGGMTASNALMQIQANALQRPIVRPSIQETTALGAARLAMETAGLRPQFEMDEERFLPDGELESEFARWTRARQAVQSMAGN